MLRPLLFSALLATALVAPQAQAQQAPTGTGLEGYGTGPNGNPPPPPPDGRGFGGPPPHDPFAGLPRPLTAEAVRQALEEQYSRRPHVGRVSDKDASTLMVEVIMPDGRSQTMLVDKQTGAHQPLR